MFESSSLFLADAQLEQVAALQRTMNASFAQLCQLLTELHHDAPEPDAEFLADQVALLLQVCPVTAQNLLGLALTVTGLPALLEALQRDLLTERHVRAIIGELGKTPLTQLQQAAVVAVVLAKLHGQTPGELVRLVQRTVLLIDLGAAERRRQARIRERRVSFHPGTDGEATLIATGPLAQIAAVKASLEATTAHPQPRDERSHDERMFDMFIDLLTGGHDRPEHWTAAVVVPYSTSQGGELELAEVPGFGPILPSTARDLLHHTRGVQRVAVDNRDGHVITVDEHTHIPQPDEVPGRTPTAMGDNRFASSAAAQAAQQPIDLTQPNTAAYRIPGRLRRFIQARDRTCVFPGCTRDARSCDLDHRQPWPTGTTDDHNLQALCRHHHRAKHAAFHLLKLADGTYRWQHHHSRPWYDRPPKGH